MSELCEMSALELAKKIKQKKVSPVEVVKAVFQRIAERNPALNAYVTLTEEQALKDAHAAEAALMTKSATLGPLHGVPYSVKDVIPTKGIRTTFGTALFRDFIPEEDGVMVTRMREAGAILLGKTNTPMFGYLGVTHNLLFGSTKNPFDLTKTSGGSSGGAAAAVASGMGPIAIGTDGGGSIRIPASFCGIFGFKPTQGRWPIYPPSSVWSGATTAPLTRTVSDAALLMNICSGPDSRDITSLPHESLDYLKALRKDVKDLRIAYCEDYGFVEAIDPEVAAICRKASEKFRSLGCHVEEVKPNWPSPREIFWEIFFGGIAPRLAPFMQHKGAIDPLLYGIVEEMLTHTPSRYVESWMERFNWCQHPNQLFEKYDLLLTPTVACAPFAAGLDNPLEIAGTPITPFAWIVFSYIFNLTGAPAASIPCGFTKAGLPVGLQIAGPRFSDALVLQASASFERCT